ncbi:MAG: dihydroorotate dehydrogenase [Pseudomonadota bacterium]|nr:dihydroorotate dehydrogenase [Pseudomonadota bacterium]
MRLVAKLADFFNGVIQLLPNHVIIKLYSIGRSYFMSYYYKNNTHRYINAATSLQPRVLWGLKFNLPLMNSAGMFKNGEGYDIVCRQGAGGYLGGTSTYNPRTGNIINGVKLPFVKLLKSGITINCLGLPNLGDEVLSRQKIITDGKRCPIGWSLMRSPDYNEEESLQKLLQSLWLYHDNLQIDFLEINESCPNVKVIINEVSNVNHAVDSLAKRLIYIGENFLAQRKRQLPVIVKLSVDIDYEYLKTILNILFKYKFDGINLGNTSVDYTNIRLNIVNSELKLFDYFVNNFKGGVGGYALKQKSLDLCKCAVDYRNMVNPDYEFHVLRSGGIDSINDIYASDRVGVSMNQWYSGYFTNYIKYGDMLYVKF